MATPAELNHEVIVRDALGNPFSVPIEKALEYVWPGSRVEDMDDDRDRIEMTGDPVKEIPYAEFDRFGYRVAREGYDVNSFDLTLVRKNRVAGDEFGVEAAQ